MAQKTKIPVGDHFFDDAGHTPGSQKGHDAAVDCFLSDHHTSDFLSHASLATEILHTCLDSKTLTHYNK